MKLERHFGSNRRGGKRQAKNTEKWCYRCEKYHPTTKDHWHQDVTRPHGLGNNCRHAAKKKTGRKTKKSDMPILHPVLSSFLRHLVGGGS